MLQLINLTAWLRALGFWIATLKSVVFRPPLYFFNMLRRFRSTQKAARYLEYPELLSLGSTGFVYKLSDAIVVKMSRPERSDKIVDEQKIFAILNRQPPSPYIVQHFHDTKDAIFLEFMSGGNLGTILNDEQVKEESTRRLIRVKKVQPAEDCLRWMRQLAAAATWLEQLGLAHCDIRPANILLSDARNIKLADFDHTRKIGDSVECLTEPFARLLGKEGGSDCGTYGTVGCRTEQFAMRSVFYALTRGYNPHEDEWWGPDHGPICQSKFMNMEFPVLAKKQIR